MNKILKVVLVLFIIVAVAGGSFAVYKYFTSEEKPPIIEDPHSGDGILHAPGTTAKDIIVQDVKIENITDNRYIDCTYPKITNLTDSEYQNYINKQIATVVNQYRNEIEYIIDDETEATEMYKYVTTYSRYNCQKYLSLVVDNDFQTGGIRSNKWEDIYNIDVQTERIFYLEDLFEPGLKYEEAIIAEITKQAKAKNIELMGGNGITKLAQKQKFYIKDDKLIIYFNPSETAANAFGELHFEMPFVMNENGYFEISQD